MLFLSDFERKGSDSYELLASLTLYAGSIKNPAWTDFLRARP